MPHAEIPTLVVLIPLMALSLVTVLWRLRQRGALTVPRVAVGVATCVYGAGLLDQVLLPLSFSTDPSYVQQPWWVWVQVTPLITADPAGIILNVALFAPLGILLPLVARISSARAHFSRPFCRASALSWCGSFSPSPWAAAASPTSMTSWPTAPAASAGMDCFGSRYACRSWRAWPRPRRGPPAATTNTAPASKRRRTTRPDEWDVDPKVPSAAADVGHFRGHYRHELYVRR